MHSPDKYHGHYVGIVIQNDDPDKMGRVKVFVPHVSPTVYGNWIDSERDIYVRFMGLNVKSELSIILPKLKEVLPWAELASPITGEDSVGRYKANIDFAAITDASTPDLAFAAYTGTETPAMQNEKHQITDGFSKKDGRQMKLNPHGASYNRQSLSGSGHGSFGIPSVGAKVWVFFQDGDPQYPVVFAVTHTQLAWKTVLQSDYPGAFENDGREITPLPTPSNSVYTSKATISHKGGAIEFINTDGKEKLITSHISGSFHEFGNDAAIEYNSSDKSEFTRGDKFETIGNDSSQKVNGHENKVIDGNSYENIGIDASAAVRIWKTTATKIAETKQLFDTQRTMPKFSPIKTTSALQLKIGTHHTCPVCSSGEIRNTVTGPQLGYVGKNPLLPPLANSSGDIKITSLIYAPQSSVPMVYPTPVECPSCTATGISPSTEDGIFVQDPIKIALAGELATIANALIESEKQMGIGGSKVINVSKDVVINVGAVMNDFGSFRIDEIGRSINVGVGLGLQGTFPYTKPKALIEMVNPLPLPGGTYTINAGNAFNVKAGACGISLQTTGNFDISSGVTNIGGLKSSVNSKYHTSITSDSWVSLKSKHITLEAEDEVFIGSRLGIDGNAMFNKSVHVHGELSVNHVTAPVEIQETIETIVQGSATVADPSTGLPVPPMIMGYVPISVKTAYAATADTTSGGAPLIPVIVSISPGSALGIDQSAMLAANAIPSGAIGTYNIFVPVYTQVTGMKPAKNSITMEKHSHYFQNIPIRFFGNNVLMRTAIRNIDSSLKNEHLSPSLPTDL